MSKLYDLLSAMCGKIKKPDWNQNDPAAPDYVKNRPFWTDDPVETDIIAESTHTIEAGSYYNIEDANFNLVEGETYKVVWDGVEYELTARNDGYDDIYIGNQAAMEFDGWEFHDANDSDAPFFIYSSGEGIISVIVMTSGTYTLRFVAAIKEVHKIDEKYLPDTLVRKSEYTDKTIPVLSAGDCFDFGVSLFEISGSQVSDREITLEEFVEALNLCFDISNGDILASEGMDFVKTTSANGTVNLFKNVFDKGVFHCYTTVMSYDEGTKLVTATYSSTVYALTAT